MKTKYEERHQRQNLSEDADQTEYQALKDGQANIDQGLYDERIADAMDDFDIIDTSSFGTETPDWALEDLQQDDAVGGLTTIIERRSEILRQHYPFSRKKNTLIYEPTQSLVYEFCLAAAVVTTKENCELPRIFEQLATMLVRCYLGAKGKSLHTGWPRQPQSRFKEAMSPLHKQTGEWYWQPDHDLPTDPHPKDIKDSGLDFVAWMPHMDKRTGNLFLLGQCACGNNWENKYGDIDVARLARWFSPMTHVPPVRVFCTPYHITEQLLVETSQRAGLVFDRLRLTLLAETADQHMLDQLKRLNLGDHL